MRRLRLVCVLVIAGFLVSAPALRADECTPPSSGPDAVVMDVVGDRYWATMDGVSAFSFGSDILNKGNQPLPWQLELGIAQNVYRLKDNRFEQIGMSWVKLGWQATTQSTFCDCVPPGSFSFLGVGCSDVYDSSHNGTQLLLVPRSQVNAYTGDLPPLPGNAANELERRVQVAVSDIDPALNANASYFAELQLVSPHEISSGNSANNSTYRSRTVVFLPQHGTFGFQAIGSTLGKAPAIFAWAAGDSSVSITPVDVPAEGRFFVASRVSENGDGTWHYEYAIFNLNSHRSARSFSVPVQPGITVTSIGFHDVGYHSGEPYDGTDWQGVHENSTVTWSTDSFDVNPDANALRWGTLYNFRFDAIGPPSNSSATLGLFRPGTPSEVAVSIRAPVVAIPSVTEGGRVMMGGLIVAAGWWVMHRAGRHV